MGDDALRDGIGYEADTRNAVAAAEGLGKSFASGDAPSARVFSGISFSSAMPSTRCVTADFPRPKSVDYDMGVQ
ncbi:hypothetical protein [Bifidobacterium sp.]|jgi:hypothetical protein|uniref:hypothetical protein n=1 Tax=Bifidobacterium sp. TaxID=41200 RepID=UPI0025C114A0|nr:hypothetical protein [Bifidobacterium sp.]MCH4208626.1 hypothetical protein [Bifidobacterium sp.]MCI1224401.1 hypothetical protein [Bifidobacterium sp.]